MLAILLNDNQKENQNIEKELNKLLGENASVSISDEKLFLNFIRNNTVGIVLMDTRFISLTNKIKASNKKVNIIYLSADDSFKKDAFDYRASGYIIRPVNPTKLKNEIANLRYEVNIDTQKKLRIQCFGNFDVFTTKGKIISFKRSKSKELFAYLVSKHGTSCTTRELMAVLFEEDNENTSHYIQQIISSLGKTLKENDCECVLHRSRNAIAIDVDYLDCDYYRFLDGDATAKRLYTGEFMMQYEWADYVSAFLDSKSL